MRRSLSIIILALFISCDREIPSPVSNPAVPALPSTPTNLTVTVGDRTLQLSWQMPDTSADVAFRIYRADSLAGQFVVVDTTSAFEYADSYLQNGRIYFYRVSAFNSNGLEGEKSSPAYGTPNLYSLIINNGDEQTNSRGVLLTLVAPSNTVLMSISNSADFAGSVWEPFADSKPWLLTQGSGLKTVYAMFRDAYGSSTADIVSDNIAFEILAYQYSIIVNGGAKFSYSRDVELNIGSPPGTSYMMISNSADFSDVQWEAFVPSKPWHIPNAIAANQDTVAFYALFRDENGDSIAVEAADSIILACSDPVDLFPVYQMPDYYQSISLEWSRSLSNDFLVYRLFRSRGGNSVDSIIASVNDFSQIGHIDNINLNDLPDSAPDSVYYMIRFFSIYDDSSDSDTILVILQNNQPPPVSCFIGDVVYDSNDVGGMDLQAVLNWSKSDIPDFYSYVVFESTSLDTTTAGQVAYIYDKETLSYNISKVNVESTDVFYF